MLELLIKVLTGWLLQDERDALVARSVKEIAEKTSLYTTVSRELKEKSAEAEQLKACLEGG